MTKRIFEIIFSTIGILILTPVFLVVAILIKVDSSGPVFFTQERVGRSGRVFKLFKFRTMVKDRDGCWQGVTSDSDRRITNIGRFLRKYRIDEFPQLFNVIKGEMSLVGPRPELLKFTRCFPEQYSKILEVKPGITDPAAIRFKDEVRNLSEKELEQKYIADILPKKIELYLGYIEKQNALFDIKIIIATLYVTIFKNT